MKVVCGRIEMKLLGILLAMIMVSVSFADVEIFDDVIVNNLTVRETIDGVFSSWNIDQEGNLTTDTVEVKKLSSDSIIVDYIAGLLGNWEIAPMSVMPDSADGVGFYAYGDQYGPRTTFVGTDGGGMCFLETHGSANIFLMTETECSNTVYWGSMPKDSMPNTDWDYLTNQYQFSLYYDSEWNVIKLRDSTGTIFAIDEDDSLFAVEEYNFDVWFDLTAGTIEADNGWDGSWVNAESDTVKVVGGVIVDVVSP